jgi:nicotinamidase-related amidase
MMSLTLHLRTRVELFKGSGASEEVVIPREIAPERAALVICDMWNRHWCRSAQHRASNLAWKMQPVIDAARAQGVRIIHAPSECMETYDDTPQRQFMKGIPVVEPPEPVELLEPKLPIDDWDGGCDDEPQDHVEAVWTKQHPAIPIGKKDGISDSGAEIYSLLRAEERDWLLVMGVHTNMCILNRPFGLRQMTRWGVKCVLVRDMTDAMYNPRRSPFVDHATGTELVIQHIESWICPTIVSADLLRH